MLIQDIEDLPGNSPVSRYFSPVQTRKQRKVNAESDPNLAAKKARQAIKTENSKTTKIRIGSATITKCEVVPEVKNETNVMPITVKPEVNAPNTAWWDQLENIRLMRSETPAPVDIQGCHQCADANADEKVNIQNTFTNFSIII